MNNIERIRLSIQFLCAIFRSIGSRSSVTVLA